MGKEKKPQRAECDNCGHVMDVPENADIPDLEQRIEPGGEVPACECSECGALAYLVKDKKGKPRQKVFVTTVDHRHGTDVWVNRTRQGADKAIARYCRDWWHEVQEREEDDELAAPKDDAKLVADYFILMEDESHEVQEMEVGE